MLSILMFWVWTAKYFLQPLTLHPETCDQRFEQGGKLTCFCSNSLGSKLLLYLGWFTLWHNHKHSKRRKRRKICVNRGYISTSPSINISIRNGKSFIPCAYACMYATLVLTYFSYFSCAYAYAWAYALGQNVNQPLGDIIDNNNLILKCIYFNYLHRLFQNISIAMNNKVQ